MTRKKFVKQLMALGYQRNHAEGMAMYARRTGCTYEDYLETEKRYHGTRRAFENVKISLVDHVTPVLKAAAQVVENTCKAIEEALSQTPFGQALLNWAMKNAPQIAEHPADALDAMTYAAQNYQTLLHPLPDNVQVMSRAEPDIMHGYACGVDLAAGPDMTAYKPAMRWDSMLINQAPVVCIKNKTATELAEEIEEKLWPQGGGGV